MLLKCRYLHSLYMITVNIDVFENTILKNGTTFDRYIANVRIIRSITITITKLAIILHLCNLSMDINMSSNIINMEISAEKTIEKFNSLRTELLQVLEDWYQLMFIKKQEIEFLYENIFGDIEEEIEEKSRSAAELQRKVDLLCSKMKRGERISKSTLDQIHQIIDNEMNSGDIWQQQFSNNSSYSNAKYQQEKKDIGGLYRCIVKKLHPDIVGENESYQKYWNCVQSAYREKDSEKLDLFRKTLCPEYVTEWINNDKIYNELFELQKNIISEKRKLEVAKNQEPFVFENKLEDRMWQRQRRDMLYSKLDNLDKKIHFNRKMIKTLTAHIHEQ